MLNVVSKEAARADFNSIEQHLGYAAALAHMQELLAALARANEDLAAARRDLARAQGSNIEEEARALVDGRRTEDSQRREIAKQMTSINADLAVLRLACQLQAEAVAYQKGIASAEIVEQARPEHARLRRAYFLALVNLGKQAEALGAWRMEFNQTGADGFGTLLPVFDLVGRGAALGSPTDDARINVTLRDAIRRGDLKRSDIPAHWKNLY